MTQLGFDLVTALGPNDPDDGDAGRQQRGMAIAAITRLEKHRLGYRVPSQSGNGSYIVDPDTGNPCCSCPDFDTRQEPCKHIYAVQITIRREEEVTVEVDGTVVQTTTETVSFRQSWANYNAAQEHEEEHFAQLLRALCDLIEQPPQTKGRPRLPLADAVFAAGLKVYGTKSMRLSMTDVRTAGDAGLMDKTPSRTSTFRTMEDPALAPVLRNLIEISALPLKAIEQDFAADSSGFGSKSYVRWFDKKWGRSEGKEIREAKWVKCHIMCGVMTNIITAVEVTANESADAPHLPAFVETTAKHFTVRDVSADKAYLSRKNLQAIEAVGGAAYIPFKSNSRPGNNGEVWKRLYHFFHLNRPTFLEHYHKRSNVETTFHMVKAKFGAVVRAKASTAMVNEVLLKLLCHNIAVLIQAMYDLDLDPVLSLQQPETFGPKSLVGPKVA